SVIRVDAVHVGFLLLPVQGRQEPIDDTCTARRIVRAERLELLHVDLSFNRVATRRGRTSEKAARRVTSCCGHLVSGRGAPPGDRAPGARPSPASTSTGGLTSGAGGQLPR